MGFLHAPSGQVIVELLERVGELLLVPVVRAEPHLRPPGLWSTRGHESCAQGRPMND